MIQVLLDKKTNELYIYPRRKSKKQREYLNNTAVHIGESQDPMFSRNESIQMNWNIHGTIMLYEEQIEI